MWKPIALITLAVAALMAAIIVWLARDPGQVQGNAPDAAGPIPIERTEGTATAEPPADNASGTPPGFCERDFTDAEAREADVEALRAQGGLVYIFEREARLDDPYGCADFYLAHGLDVNAIDPRPDSESLSGLFYAIQRNDPRMLRFMLEQGADPRQRAGENDIRATGYAYSLAMQDQRIDRNEIIGLLDAALADTR